MTESEKAPDVRIIRGTANEEELAALLAVVTDAYSREAESAVVEEANVSVWERTQRPTRRSLRRDIPWGRFSG